MASDLGRIASQQLNSKQILEKFADSVSIHGIRFANSRSKIRRIFWTMLVLTFCGLLLSQIIGSYLKLKVNKHITSIEISPSPQLKFPAITICNINMMKKSKVAGTTAQLYLDLLDPKEALNAKNKLETYNVSFDIREAVLKYGHDAKDLIEFCIWRGKKCTFSNFTTRFSHMYGLCHTFNSGANGHPVAMSTTTLKDDGVILGLNVHAKEYYGASSYLASAVIVAVHDQNDDPMIEDYGFEILGGTTAEIRIARFEKLSLEPPYKSACGTRDLQTTNTYSTSRCKQECLSRVVMNRCQCKLLGMPELPEFKKNNTDCNSVHKLKSCDALQYAVGLTGLRWQLKPAECDCPIPCDKVSYTAQVYSMQKKFKVDIMELMRLNDIPANGDDLQNNDLMIINAFYKTLSTVVTVESPLYDKRSFFSDIGGFAGLFLGCSFISLFELLDLFFKLCIAKFKTRINDIHFLQRHQDVTLR